MIYIFVETVDAFLYSLNIFFELLKEQHLFEIKI